MKPIKRCKWCGTEYTQNPDGVCDGCRQAYDKDPVPEEPDDD